MKPDDAFDPDEVRIRLVEAKLGKLVDWRVPRISKTVGPFDLSAFKKYKAEIDELRKEVETFVWSLSDQEIHELAVTQDREAAIFQRWRSHKDFEIAQLRKKPPAWFVGGFGHPDFEADFESWCKMPRWAIDEAVSITIGIEPGHFQLRSLEDMCKGSLHGLEGTTRFISMRFEQLRRKFGQHGRESTVAPRDLLQWAQRVSLEMHPECERLLKLYHTPEKNVETEDKSVGRKPDRRELHSIAKLFTAMAIEYYGFDPKEKKSPTPREISDLAASMGMTISDDTVRNYLKMGASFIPDDWKPE